MNFIGERVYFLGYDKPVGTIIREENVDKGNSYCFVEWDENSGNVQRTWECLVDLVFIDREKYEEFEEKLRDRMPHFSAEM